MGATRKLQSEIDKVLKKVHEGVEVFDSIWNKVYDTENANQKEKFEADLKKEIKKLQRYRDQIKTWIQSSEIKDKKVAANYEQYLVDARKMIEREMERFKVCEKETKTKAFSKEGLGQQPKTDPREKAKAETREWLNNMVDELQSGIDTFESEMEGLASKKGRNRPPRLVHLEESAARHKSHITKLELILRLLDNDELSADDVNDSIKDLVEDYLERNQEDFDEFANVDDIYSQLPLEKMEAMEALDAVPSVPPSIIVKERAAVAAASGATTNGANAKASLPAVTVAATTSSAAAVSQASSGSSSTLEDAISEEKTSAISITGSAMSPTTSTPMQPDIASSPTTARPVATPPGLLARTQKTASSVTQSSPIAVGKPKEDELNRRANAGDGGLSRSFGRPAPLSSPSPQTPNLSVPSNTTSPAVTPADTAKRNLIDSTQLSSPISTQRAFGGKLGEAIETTDTGLSNRGGQWRDQGQIQSSPDPKQKFLQKLQQTSSSSLLNTPSLPHLTSPAAKQQSSQSALLQQTFLQQQQQHSPPAQMPQAAISQLGSQAQLLSGTPQSQPQGAPVQVQQAVAAKDTVSQSDAVLTRNLEQRQQSPLRVKLADEGSPDTAAFTRSLTLNEDDLKNSDTFDVAVQGPGTLAEFSQLSRDADFSSAQQVPPSPTPGVIGRKELGAIGENLPPISQQYDHALNLQLLEAAYRHLPQPKDSERPRSYAPRNPAMTPGSYPQTPSQFIDNPSLWDKFETDVLFFSFYYQQGTYQQYLAARELKKQSWRYHKKYNTWFQRHEEPKVTSDDFEQGTYVYFDFHIVEDLQQGWVQRIKTEFTFEYSFLEDELQVN